MNKISIVATSVVSEADLALARLGQRFGRLDLQSQLALLAVASLKVDFAQLPPEHIGICLAASAGSLRTDLNFWNGRSGVGGPSPTLFAYTLPSAAVGEIAIHFGLTGPDLCFVGDGQELIGEAVDLIRCDKVAGCLCVFCDVVSPEIAKIISLPPAAAACAVFLKRGEDTDGLRELREFDRDMKALCALLCAAKSAS